jgi:DNA-directed RNA polymerase subunit K/omega
MGKFLFAVLASRRAVQLTRGCTPRVTGIHKRTTMAQLEVAQGKVIEDLTPVLPAGVV